MVREAIGQRDAISRWVISAGGVDAAIAPCRSALGIDPAMTQPKLEAEIFDGP